MYTFELFHVWGLKIAGQAKEHLYSVEDPDMFIRLGPGKFSAASVLKFE